MWTRDTPPLMRAFVILGSLFLAFGSSCDNKIKLDAKVIPDNQTKAPPLVVASLMVEQVKLPLLPPSSNFAKQTNNAEEVAAAFALEGDIVSGMQFFESTPLFEGYEDHLMTFSKRLAREAPDQGLKWLGNLEWSQMTAAALRAFGGTLCEASSAAAVEAGSKIKTANVKASFYRGVTRAIALHSVDTAIALIRSTFPVLSDQNYQIRGLAWDLSHDAKLVLQLSRLYPNIIDPNDFGRSLYKLWKEDSNAAQQNITDATKGKSVHAIYDSFTSEFVRDNPVAASEWVKALPVGVARDGAVTALARDISSRFPLDALRWSITINSDFIRDASMGTLLRNALSSDETVTRNIIETSGLSPEEVAKWSYQINSYLTQGEK
jgi:hypothetical protein